MTFSPIPDTSFVNNVDLHQAPSCNGAMPQPAAPAPVPPPRSGDKAKARAILAAIRTLQASSKASGPPPRTSARPRPFPRLRPGGPGHLPGPGHRPVQRRRLAAARGAAPGSLDAGGLRQRRTRPPSPPFTPRPWSSRPCTRPWRVWVCRRGDRTGAGLWHRQLHRPRPGGHALHRCGARPSLRTDGPRAAPRPRYPYRALPRHPPARRPYRRRHRQRALRRSPAWTTTACASRCMTSFSPSPSTR